MRKWTFALLVIVNGLSATAAGQRVALIIGNDAYVRIGALQNAANDARKLDEALRASGFETTVKFKLNRRGFYSTVDAICRTDFDVN